MSMLQWWQGFLKSVNLRVYINMKNKVGVKELMGTETHLMCFVGARGPRRGAASINSLEFLRGGS